MKQCHQSLAAGRWMELSLVEQLANIGSEVERALSFRSRQDQARTTQSFERALELFDITLASPKLRFRLKEIARVRELFCDYMMGENSYQLTDQVFQKYFHPFFYAARKDR